MKGLLNNECYLEINYEGVTLGLIVRVLPRD